MMTSSSAVLCGPVRNLTPLFVKSRLEHKRRRQRFRPSVLLGAAVGGRLPVDTVDDKEDDLESGSTTEPPTALDNASSPHASSVTSAGGASSAGRTQLLLGRSYRSSRAAGHSTDIEMMAHSTSAAHRTATASSNFLASASPGGGDALVGGPSVPSLPPLWVDLVEETHHSISRIKEMLSALQKLQQRRLFKVFGDDHTGQPDKNIQKLSDDITLVFRQAESKVKGILGAASEVDGSGRSPHAASGSSAEDSEIKLRKNAQSSLAAQIQALSTQFRKQQKHFAGELKKRAPPPADGSSPVDLLGAPQPSATEIAEKQKMLFQHGFSEAQVAELEEMEREVDSRNEEISHIARSVAEMHSIFKELATMVVEQGTILDRIDYNMEQVVDRTQQANVHIRKAEEYQRNSRANRVIMFLVVGIVVLALLFVWKHS